MFVQEPIPIEAWMGVSKAVITHTCLQYDHLSPSGNYEVTGRKINE